MRENKIKGFDRERETEQVFGKILGQEEGPVNREWEENVGEVRKKKDTIERRT